MKLQILVGATLVVSVLSGCEEEVATAPPSTAAPVAAEQPKKVRKRVGAEESASEEDQEGPPQVEFQEADFTETDRSRDPFRNFAKMFAEQAKSRVKSQREVVLDQYSVDELKLVGIVSRIEPAKAMLVDPTGKGHVVQRGQFVGRAEIVQGGTSGADYEINWRIDRIRDSDLILVREDPANPDVPSSTRVIQLPGDDTT